MKSSVYLVFGIFALAGCSPSEQNVDGGPPFDTQIVSEEVKSSIYDRAIFCIVNFASQPSEKSTILISYEYNKLVGKENNTWIVQKKKKDALGAPFIAHMVSQSDPADTPYIWLVQNSHGFFGSLVWEKFNAVEGMNMTFISNKFPEPVLGQCGRLPVPQGKQGAKS